MTCEELYQELAAIPLQDRPYLEARVVVYLKDRAGFTLPVLRTSGPGFSGPFNLVIEEPPSGVGQ